MIGGKSGVEGLTCNGGACKSSMDAPLCTLRVGVGGNWAEEAAVVRLSTVALVKEGARDESATLEARERGRAEVVGVALRDFHLRDSDGMREPMRDASEPRVSARCRFASECSRRFSSRKLYSM